MVQFRGRGQARQVLGPVPATSHLCASVRHLTFLRLGFIIYKMGVCDQPIAKVPFKEENLCSKVPWSHFLCALTRTRTPRLSPRCWKTSRCPSDTLGPACTPLGLAFSKRGCQGSRFAVFSPTRCHLKETNHRS